MSELTILTTFIQFKMSELTLFYIQEFPERKYTKKSQDTGS